MKKTDGFTLIELLVGILCAALITGAAMSMLLMGVRVNRSLGDANTDQQNTRIIMSLIEGLASEGNVETIETVGTQTTDSEGNDLGNRDWTLRDHFGNIVLSYSASGDAIRTKDGATLMTGVTASTASFDDNKLFTISLTTDEGSYQTSIYCRTAEPQESKLELSGNNKVEITTNGTTTEEIESEVDEENAYAGRMALLATLCDKYGTSSGETYNKWYCGGSYWDNWNAETPWCATFLSWAIAQIPSHFNSVPKEANVDNLWDHMKKTYTNTPTNRASITPGDFIFFSWDNDPNTLEHVGAVFAVDNTWVYTIEGNSGGKVALHRYLLNDASIVGYGVLDWKTTS